MLHKNKNTSARFLCLFLLMAAALTAGCGYGEVSQETYDYATALYSICNRQDVERLDTFSTQLSEAREAGEVSEKEAEWLEEIVLVVREGHWQDAAADARRMLADQVEGGP